MRALLISLLVLSVSVQAQEPVRAVPDALGWGTAAVNPTVSLIRAFRSENRGCHLKQLALSSGIAGAGVVAQRFIVSPRPCAPVCRGNGMPSLHAAFGSVGSSAWNVTFGLSFAMGTAGSRVWARRHNRKQAVAGLLLGELSEWAGQKLMRCGG